MGENALFGPIPETIEALARLGELSMVLARCRARSQRWSVL